MTASACTHNPIDTPNRLRSNRRPDEPLRNSPAVRNNPPSVAITGGHRQRPNATNPAGISRMKNTGGTFGYAAPEAIWITTPAAAITDPTTINLPATDNEGHSVMFSHPYTSRNAVTMGSRMARQAGYIAPTSPIPMANVMPWLISAGVTAKANAT
jgi:hypothetical protein